MKHTIKMVGIDMDGTLLTQKKELLPYTRDVLKRAIEKGVEIVADTGRPLSGIPKDYKEIPGIRYAVTANGARIVDLQTGETIYEALIPQKKVIEVLNIFSEYDVLPEVYKNGQAYMNKEHLEILSPYFRDPHMEEYVRTTRKGTEDIWKLVEECTDGMEKVQAIFKHQEDQEAARKRIQAIPEVKPVSSINYNLEVSKSDANKGSGLLKLAEILGIEKEEMMAIGDNDNDIEMLQMSGIGVAMGNAIPEVLDIADYVTVSNDEEGAAKAIEKFVLSPQNQ